MRFVAALQRSPPAAVACVRRPFVVSPSVTLRAQRWHCSRCCHHRAVRGCAGTARPV
jgi:hypothetical protein